MPTRRYDDYLTERLQDRDEAASYLTACLEDSDNVFFLGLGKVIAANGGIKAFAEEANLEEQHISEVLSQEGATHLSHLATLLRPLGLRMEIISKQSEPEAA